MSNGPILNHNPSETVNADYMNHLFVRPRQHAKRQAVRSVAMYPYSVLLLNNLNMLDCERRSSPTSPSLEDKKFGAGDNSLPAAESSVKSH